jgi:hypothetical protein
MIEELISRLESRIKEAKEKVASDNQLLELDGFITNTESAILDLYRLLEEELREANDTLDKYFADIAVEDPALYEQFTKVWEQSRQISEQLADSAKSLILAELKNMEAGTQEHKLYSEMIALYHKHTQMSEVYTAYFRANQ